MKLEWLVIGIMVVALVIAFNMILKLGKKVDETLPVLGKDDHIPIIKKGESNLSIIRKGADTLVSDEEGNLIPFRKTIE